MSTKAPLPPTGTRDFLPDAVRARRRVTSVIMRCFERHGYEPLETPAMERLEVLLGKYGEEGDKLLFKVLHRGDKLRRALENPTVTESDLAELGLRYDLTVPLARVAANYPEQLTRIFKRYQIQPVWRADRPAKGRFREFYQCDVDILGSSELLAELDIFCAIGEIMDELGLPDFELHLNHRKWLSAFLRALDIPPAQHTAVLGVLDKMDKVGPEAVLAELQEKNLSAASRDLPAWFERFSVKRPQPDVFTELVDAEGQGALSDIARVLEWDAPRGGRIVWNPLLARGLDYYTGLIYELRIPPAPSSFGGGGRYDNLIGMFSGRPVPAVGFSFGLERLLDLLEERQALAPSGGHAQAVAVILDPSVLFWALDVISALRSQGIAIDLYPEISGAGKALKWADKKHVGRVLFFGPDEKERQTVSWKDLATGASGQAPLADLPPLLA